VNFSQGDARWGKKEIVKGQTLARVGCLITAMAEAAVRMGTGPEMTPSSLLDRARLQGGVFNTSGGAVVAKLAKAALLVADPAERRFAADGLEAQRRAIYDSLSDSRLCLLHVDYSDDADLRGNHFVCAIGLYPSPQGTELEYVDPAFGAAWRMSHVSLEGQSKKPTRRYRVVSAIPLRIL
jgi:hypothetical protein